MYKIRLTIIFVIIIFLFSISTVCYSFLGFKSGSAYKSFKQFTGQENGINVTLIDDEWNSGVDAVGVVENYIRPKVAYLDYYYRDRDTLSWHHFYRKPIHFPPS